MQLKKKNQMKNNWKQVKLGDILEKIIGGGTPSRVVSQYWNGDISWATVKDMKDGVYGLSETQEKITKEGIKNSATNIIPKGTVIISTRMGLGRCFINKSVMAINQDLKALIPNKNVDVNFLLWLLVSKTKELESMGSGTTVKGIRLEELRNIGINIPEKIEDQKKIADVLSAYDDLIENNNRRIKILEEMAQLIYKEWFVDFKFPGHEKIKMIEGELGLMPEGWEVKKIKDFIDVKSGFAFSSSVYNNKNGYGLVTIKNVQDAEFIIECTTRISSVPKNMPEHCFLREGDIILSLTGNIGRVCLVYGDKYLLNQRVAKLVPTKDEYNSFIYFLFRESKFKNKLEMVSNGVAQQNLSPIEMGEIKIIFPANNYMEMFHENVRYIIETIIVLKNKNNILRQTRDLLLPKLMSGEIKVYG